MLRITDAVTIADWELTESFVRASGPGGQNVNKVATAVELRFEAARSPHLDAGDQGAAAPARRAALDARRRADRHLRPAPHPGTELETIYMARKKSSWRSTGRRIGKVLGRKSQARPAEPFRSAGWAGHGVARRPPVVGGRRFGHDVRLGGRVVQDLGLGKNEEIFATAVQSDGKIVVAGMAVNTGSSGRLSCRAIQLEWFARQHVWHGRQRNRQRERSGPAGASTNQDDIASDLVIQADGSILVAGSAVKNVTVPGGQTNQGVGVIQADFIGVLDTSFDGDGKLITVFETSPGQRRNTVAGDSHPTSIALTPDGKIVVGTSSIATSGVAALTRWDYTVARYNANGSLDTSFDTDGYQITDIDSTASSNADDFMHDVKVQSDGKIVVVEVRSTTTSSLPGLRISRLFVTTRAAVWIRRLERAALC